MRTFLTLLSLGIAVIGLTPSQARGQMAGDPINGYVQGGQPAGVAPFQTRLPGLWPGNVWLEANLADNGLGYSGAYMSLGAKTRLFEDWFDGRWVLQTQGNLSLDRGGFFSNVGLERNFTIDAVGSDIYLGAWYDYDDDQQGDFGHTYHQLGISGGVRSKYWDLIGNAYLPSGETSHFLGDPTGSTVFFRNSIVTQLGFDSALEGFDANVVMRPEILAFVNGNIGFGGYAYQSDAVDMFGGISGRVGIQTLRGLLTSIQVNHDERFDTTAVLQVGWIFGARGSRTEYSPVGRDLEPTLRNDHIVRTQQELLLAIDPDNNDPYVVFHVDNTAAPGGDGSFERPFQTLAQAQAASGQQNIIYVHQGDGTTTGMDQGIALKNGQLLLGDGIVHRIPVVGGTFDIFNDLSGGRPVITNTAGNAVTLASDNTVRNFDIDGGAGGMANGIFGDGGAGTLTDGIIEDVRIFGNPIIDGISLTNISGDWRFARNEVRTAGRDGVFINGMSGAASTLTVLDSEFSGNLRDGFHIENFTGDRFVFSRNTTDGNIRDGLRMQNYTGTNGTFDITDHNAAGNAGFGIHLNGLDGDVSITNATLTGNTGGGIQTVNVTGDTLISGATITGNGTGIRNELNAGTQDLTITNSTIDDNNLGIFSQAAGIGTVLNTSIVGNGSISDNQTDAVRVISRLGATHEMFLGNVAPPGILTNPLVMQNNANLSGIGISIFAEDGGAATSVMRSELRNIEMTDTGNGVGTSGILVSGVGNSQTEFLAENITHAGANGGNAVRFTFATTNALVNSVTMNNVELTDIGANGIVATLANQSTVDFFFNEVTATGNTDSGGGGFVYVASDNSLSRLQMFNSEFNSFNLDGVSLETEDNARLFAILEGNTADDNGRSDLPDPDLLPFEDGFTISSFNNSQLTAIFRNNNAHGNFERGFQGFAGGTSTMVTLFEFNSFTNNDLGEDANNDPIVDNNIEDFELINGVTATSATALTNNFFALPATLASLGAAADFTVELDGNTNQIPPTLINVTPTPFGTVVAPLITAEEAFFQGAGFP